MILEEIIEHKRREVAERQQHSSLEEMKRRAAVASPPRPIQLKDRISLIAEVKRRSPSRGELVTTLDPSEQARAYERGGAAAISVLTDEHYFGGSFEDLAAVHAAVQVPVLCKDFILTTYQVFEARAYGADLLLLIVAAIDDSTLVALRHLAEDVGMMPLVEVHDQHDLARAIAADARFIGINNRDLTDFSVSLLTTEYLAPLVPDDSIIISESGMETRDDVERAIRAGVQGVLVGETLMRSADPASTIQELVG